MLGVQERQREGYGVGVWKAIRGGWDAFKGRIVFERVSFPYGMVWNS